MSAFTDRKPPLYHSLALYYSKPTLGDHLDSKLVAEWMGSPGDTASLHLIPSESCCFELFCHMWETSKGPKGSHQHTPPSPCAGSCWLFWTVSLSFNNSCWGTLISQGPAILKSSIFPSSSKEWSMWKIPENTEVQSVRDIPLALRYSPPTNTSPTTAFAGIPSSPSVQFMKQQPPSSLGAFSNPRLPLWSCSQVLKWKTEEMDSWK